MENPTKKVEETDSSVKGNAKKHSPKWFKWGILLLLAVGVGAFFWSLIPEAEDKFLPLKLDDTVEDGYVDEDTTYTDEQEIATQDCKNANVVNTNKENVEDVCAEAEVIECPEGKELNEGKTECIEYVDTATDEIKVEPLRKLTKEQENVMHKMISNLLNLYGNDKYLEDADAYKSVMSQVLSPIYYKDDLFESTYKELKGYNARTTNVNFAYTDVDVIAVREGNNFDVLVKGSWSYKENGKAKLEKKDLLLQVQTLPEIPTTISYFKFTP